MNETMRVVGCSIDWIQTDLKMLSWKEKENQKMQGRSTAERWSMLGAEWGREVLVKYLECFER